MAPPAEPETIADIVFSNVTDRAIPAAASFIAERLQARLHEMDLSEEDVRILDAYADWAVSYSLVHEDGVDALSIIVTGVSGECGELLEEMAFSGTCMGNPQSLCLEFGDVLFYMARLMRYFGIDLRAVLSVPLDHSVLPSGHARMPISAGKVSEAIKKHIRNDQWIVRERRLIKLRDALGMLWQDWWNLRERHNVGLHALMAASRSKFDKRAHAKQRKAAGCAEDIPSSVR